MTRKLIPLVIAVAMIFSLAACGASDETTATNGAETTTTAAEGEKILLQVPYYGYTDEELQDIAQRNEEDENEEGYFESGMEEFQIKFTQYMEDNHSNYEMEYADWGWAEQLDQRIRAAMTAGDYPAIVVGEIAAPAYAQEGILAPLPDDIVDSVYDSFLLDGPDGNPSILTTTSALFHLFYNLDVLEKYGYTEDDVPTTWEEWEAIATDITERGNGEDWGGAIPSFPHYGGSLRATPFLRQMGVDWGEPDSVEMLSDPRMIETLEFIRSMNSNLPAGMGNAVDEGVLWNAWDDGEGNGNIAFIIDGTFRGSNNERTGINAGVAELPLPEGGVVANCAVGAVLVGVPKDHPNIEAAFDVVRALIRPEIAVGWVNNYRVVPSREAMDDDSLFEGKGETLIAARELYRTDNAIPGLVAFQQNSSSIWEVINQQILAAVTMTDTPIEEIVANAQSEINNLLN